MQFLQLGIAVAPLHPAPKVSHYLHVFKVPCTRPSAVLTAKITSHSSKSWFGIQITDESIQELLVWDALWHFKMVYNENLVLVDKRNYVPPHGVFKLRFRNKPVSTVLLCCLKTNPFPVSSVLGRVKGCSRGKVFYMILQGFFSFTFFFKFFWPQHAACRILVPQPGIKPESPAVQAWRLNHWTPREVRPSV